MKKSIIAGRNILKADEGMILTNGTSYGKTVVLAEGSSGDEFYEVPETEKPKDDVVSNI